MHTQLSLSKSKLAAYRQCPKRLWLSVYDPGSAASPKEAGVAAGNEVGETARVIHGPGEVLFDAEHKNYRHALEQSALALSRTGETFFESAHEADGVLVIADVLRVTPNGVEVIEVKSSTTVDDYQREDAAIQTAVMRRAGVRVSSVRIAYVNNQFVYRGGGEYRGLLAEEDVTEFAMGLDAEVNDWIVDARGVLGGSKPTVEMGRQCKHPIECPFKGHCTGPQPEYPLTMLRGLSGKRRAALMSEGIMDVRDVPPELAALEPWIDQYQAVCTGDPVIREAELAELRALPYPRYYLDFETINPAVPLWAGTRPYQQIPFQWSVHIEPAHGEMRHCEFLDLSGENPARPSMEQLIARLGDTGPVLVYSSFERTILSDMRKLLPDLDAPLAAIMERLFDLLPVAKAAYYHREMKGSWSIKKILPAIAPDLTYTSLGEVQDGTAAQRAYLEAIKPDAPPRRKEHLRKSMLDYCKRDTEAMVAVATYFAGTTRSS